MLSRLWADAPLSFQNVINITFCGSYAEGCPVPLYWVRSESTGEYALKRCDADLMFTLKSDQIVVGFHGDSGRSVNAVIDTTCTRPGYLHLRCLNGDLIEKDILLSKLSLFDLEMCEYQITLHGPATMTDSYTEIEFIHPVKNTDYVHYFPCSVWPPQAESWIKRERPSHWPTKETIHKIVEQGCAIVGSAHPLSAAEDKQFQFRFSFSFAEIALFETLSRDQKDCFIAFKAIVKSIISKLDDNTTEEVGIKTYHLKTIFLWACEYIPQDQWNTSKSWSKCFLLMIDKLLECLESRFLPSYFIPECNLLDSLKDENSVEIFVDEIRQVRLNPLCCAARFLDSLKSLHFYHIIISENLEILLESVTHEIDSFIVNQEIDVYMRECVFWDNVFNAVEKSTLNFVNFFGKLIETRMSCHFRTAYADWCKSNRCFYLNKAFSLLDMIAFKKIHGLNISLQQVIEFAKCEPFGEKPFFSEFRHLSSMVENCEDWNADLLTLTDNHKPSSMLSLSLFSIDSKQFEFAKKILVWVSDKLDLRNLSNCNIDKLYFEYTWLLSMNAVKQIHEYLYTFNDDDSNVSAKMFIYYLLCVCYKNLADYESLKINLEKMKEIPQHVRQTFDHLLLYQAATMVDDTSLASEICKSSLLSTMELVEKLIHSTASSTNMNAENVQALEAVFAEASNGDWIIENLETTEAEFEKIWEFDIPMIKLIWQMIEADDDFLDHYRSVASQLMDPILQTSFPGEQFSRCVSRISRNDFRACFKLVMTHWFTQLKEMTHTMINSMCKDWTSHQGSLCSDMMKKIFELGHNYLGKAQSHKHRECLISGNHALKLCFQKYIQERSGSASFSVENFTIKMGHMENALLTQDVITAADMIYICQLKISRKQYEAAIPLLERVLQEEFENPTSVIIWPKELHTLVDDNLRKEIDKSSTGHIVLPSVVHALYLLAFVHKSLGNDRKYEKTITDFKDLCEKIGDDCPLSKAMFIYSQKF